MSKHKPSESTHYNIYQHEGWSLVETRTKHFDDEYDRVKREWRHPVIAEDVSIIWGYHLPCEKRGAIQLTATKAECSRCGQKMTHDEFNHLSNAKDMLTKGLISD